MGADLDPTERAPRRGPDCPSDAELASLAWGGTAVGIDVAEHVATCTACRDVIAAARSAPTTSDPGIAPGTMVGRYQIVELLGAGGMGVVYRAKDVELGRHVALKLVRTHAGVEAEELSERLRRESRLLARTKHPAVVTVHDIGRDGDHVYLAMELIEGPDLRRWMTGRHDWTDVVDVLRGAGAGLAAAHAAGMVHRDFKPDNVLVELSGARVGRVAVIDFGVARAIEAGGAAWRQSHPSVPTAPDRLTAAGGVVGTLGYMAVEQLHGEAVDARTDVFAFSATLWEALFGDVPYRGANVAAVVAAMTEPLPPPRHPHHRGRVPAWVVDVVRRGLAIDARKRPPNMEWMLHALDYRGKRRRRRIHAALGAAIAVVSGAAIAVGVAGRRAAVDPCADRSAGDALDRARSTQLPAEPRAIVDDYIGVWRSLRADACPVASSARPANAADRVRCLDRRARVSAAEIAAVANAHRADPVLLGATLSPPFDCASGAAGQLAALEPTGANVQPVAAIRVLLASARNGGAPERDALEAAARSIDFPPLAQELALWRALDDVSRGAEWNTLRAVAAEADRAGHAPVAAQALTQLAWASASDSGGRIADLMAQTDAVLSRAGDPPLLRAHWLAIKAVLALQVRDGVEEARAALAAIDALRTRTHQHADYNLDSRVGLVYMALGDTERGIELVERALALAERSGPGGARSALDLRTNYALALYHGGRVDEGFAQFRSMLAGTDTRRFDVSERARALAGYAYALNTSGQPTEALALLDAWAPAIAELAASRDHVVGKLGLERADALFSAGRHTEAALAASAALEIFVERLGAESAGTADARILYGQTLVALGRWMEAKAALELGVRDLASASGPDDIRVVEGEVWLADALIGLGDRGRAVPLLERAIDAYSAAGVPEEMIAEVRAKLASAAR